MVSGNFYLAADIIHTAGDVIQTNSNSTHVPTKYPCLTLSASVPIHREGSKKPRRLQNLPRVTMTSKQWCWDVSPGGPTLGPGS